VGQIGLLLVERQRIENEHENLLQVHNYVGVPVVMMSMTEYYSSTVLPVVPLTVLLCLSKGKDGLRGILLKITSASSQFFITELLEESLE